MSERGYIKLWREEFDSVSYSKSLKHIGLMQLLRNKANYRAKMFRGEWVYPGQLAASIATLSGETGESIKTIRNLLADLEFDGFIRCVSRANRYTIITICQYVTKQGLICLDGLTEELTKGVTKVTTEGAAQGQTGVAAEGTRLENKRYLKNKNITRICAEVALLPPKLGDLWDSWLTMYETEQNKTLSPPRQAEIIRSWLALPQELHERAIREAIRSGAKAIYDPRNFEEKNKNDSEQYKNPNSDSGAGIAGSNSYRL